MKSSAFSFLVYLPILFTSGMLLADGGHSEIDAALNGGRGSSSVSRPSDEDDAADRASERAKAFINATPEIPKDAWQAVVDAAKVLLDPKKGTAGDFVRVLNENAVIRKLREEPTYQNDAILAKLLAKRLGVDLAKVRDEKSAEAGIVKSLTAALSAIPKSTPTPTATPGASLVPAPIQDKKDSLQPSPLQRQGRTPTLTPGPAQGGNPLVPGPAGTGEVNNGGGNNNANNGGPQPPGGPFQPPGAQQPPPPVPSPSINPNLNANNNGRNNQGNNLQDPGNGNNGNDQGQNPPENQNQDQGQQPQLPSPGSPGEHAQIPSLQPMQMPESKPFDVGPLIQGLVAQPQNTGFDQLAPSLGAPKDYPQVSWKSVDGIAQDVARMTQTIITGMGAILQGYMGAARPGSAPPGSALTAVQSQVNALSAGGEGEQQQNFGARRSPIGNKSGL